MRAHHSANKLAHVRAADTVVLAPAASDQGELRLTSERVADDRRRTDVNGAVHERLTRWVYRLCCTSAGEVAAFAVATAYLMFSMRESLFDGRLTLAHDTLYWFFPIYDYFAAAIAHGELPLWNAYSHGGEPLLPALLQLRLFDPLSMAIAWIGTAITHDSTVLMAWDRLARCLVTAIGCHILLRQFTTRVPVRLLLPFVLLWSSLLMPAMHQNALLDQFYTAPFFIYFVLRLLWSHDFRWSSWVGVAVFTGMSFQSYFFVGEFLAIAFIAVGFALFRRADIATLFDRRNLPGATAAAIIVVCMSGLNVAYFADRNAYYLDSRNPLPTTITSPNNGPVQFTVPPNPNAAQTLIMPYREIYMTGTFSRPVDFLGLVLPAHTYLRDSGEALQYMGFLFVLGAIVGMFAGRHALKRVWGLCTLAFGLLIMGPYGWLHWILYQFVPPLWFIRHTHALTPFFLLGMCYFFVLGTEVFLCKWREDLHGWSTDPLPVALKPITQLVAVIGSAAIFAAAGTYMAQWAPKAPGAISPIGIIVAALAGGLIFLHRRLGSLLSAESALLGLLAATLSLLKFHMIYAPGTSLRAAVFIVLPLSVIFITRRREPSSVWRYGARRAGIGSIPTMIPEDLSTLLYDKIGAPPWAYLRVRLIAGLTFAAAAAASVVVSTIVNYFSHITVAASLIALSSVLSAMVFLVPRAPSVFLARGGLRPRAVRGGALLFLVAFAAPFPAMVIHKSLLPQVFAQYSWLFAIGLWCWGAVIAACLIALMFPSVIAGPIRALFRWALKSAQVHAVRRMARARELGGRIRSLPSALGQRGRARIEAILEPLRVRGGVRSLAWSWAPAILAMILLLDLATYVESLRDFAWATPTPEIARSSDKWGTGFVTPKTATLYAAPETDEVDQRMRYRELLERRPTVLDRLWDVPDDGGDVPLSQALELERVNSFATLTSYTKLIYSDLSAGVLERLFAIGDPPISFKARAITRPHPLAFLESLPAKKAQMLLSDTVVLRGVESGNDAPDAAGTETRSLHYDVVRSGGNGFELRTVTDKPGYLYVADGFDRHWHASVDGHAVPVLWADVNFQAIALDNGVHRVVFDYRPKFLLAAIELYFAAMSLSFLVLLWRGVQRRHAFGAK